MLMGADARRVLKQNCVLAIAIKNRFAMEALTGMADTHTGIRLVTSLPSPCKHRYASAKGQGIPDRSVQSARRTTRLPTSASGSGLNVLSKERLHTPEQRSGADQAADRPDRGVPQFPRLPLGD